MAETADNGNQVISNTLSGGLKLDFRNRPELIPTNSYTHALNATNKTLDNPEIGRTQELSFEKCDVFGDNIVGFRLVEERNWSIGISQDGTIWKHDHRTKKDEKVVSPDEFGCDWGCGDCEWVGNNIQFYSKEPCSELHMQWSCDCIYYTINIDEMLDKDRKQGLIEELKCEGCGPPCDYFTTFQKACAPKITVKGYQSGGGNLPAGNYRFATRYKYKTGGYSNISYHSDVVMIGSKHNVAGQVGNGHIGITMSCVDCRFNQLELIVIEKIGGQTSAKIVDKISIDNRETYTHNYIGQTGDDKGVALEELLLPAEDLYIEGKHLMQFNNSMIYYGLKTPKNLNGQYYADQIQVGYEVAEMSAEYACQHNIRGVMRGGTYAYSISYNYCDGTSTPFFHVGGIPGSGGNSGTQGMSQTFNATFNPDTGLVSGSGGGDSGDASTSTNSGLTIACVFDDNSPELDFYYTLNRNAGASDDLILVKDGNGSSDLFDCIKECASNNDVDTSIYLTGHAGEKQTFRVYQVQDGITPNDITITGQLVGGQPSIHTEAAQICVTHILRPIGAQSSGATGAGGGAGAQSQISGQPTAEITSPQCVVRMRRHIEDQVADPQRDEWDDQVDELLNNLETTSSDTCGELKLEEDHKRAECCECGTPTCFPCGSGETTTTTTTTTTVSEEPVNFLPFTDMDGNIVNDLFYDPTNGNTVVPNSSGSGFYLADPDTGEPILGSDGFPIITEPSTQEVESEETEETECCPPPPDALVVPGPLCDPGKAVEQCNEDLGDLDNFGGAYANLLGGFINDDPNQAKRPMSLRDAARLLHQAVQNRERKYRKAQIYEITKNVSYQSGGEDPRLKESEFGDNFTDCCGKRNSDLEIRIVSSGRTIPKKEETITYPCTTDCSGKPIYGARAGTPVYHHQFPDTCVEPHFIGKSVGVPHGTYWKDSNPHQDAYIRVMYPTFSNIPIPPESELGKPLCPLRPYTIGAAKRTDANKRILGKALATGTFRIRHNDKEYDQPRYGVNSRMEVSAMHDGDNEKYPRLANLGPGESFNLFGLDFHIRQPALNVDTVVEELRLKGLGERYGLYAQGNQKGLGFNEERVDKLGARSWVNLSQWEAGACEELPLKFKIHAPAKSGAIGGGVSPPHGGSVPLMNAYQQPSVWIGADLPKIEDGSMPGVVLEHNVPIQNAEGSYVSLRRDLPNQYGELSGIKYMPILHAGKNNTSSIKGIVGDTYIGPYSFVKTGYVSDRVGSCEEDCKFNIPAQEPTKSSKRCVCDSPEDLIDNYIGNNNWQNLPQSGDVADPKNWAGLRTHDLQHTDTFAEAKDGKAVSDFWWPKTNTTLITYWGESEVNPWLREKSDLLPEQWMPELSEEFDFDSGVEVDGNGPGFENAYLNQFGCEIRQPSQLKTLLKVAIQTMFGIGLPMAALGGIATTTNPFSFVTALGTSGAMVALWQLLRQVLFTNEKLDQILGIETCKSDDVGGMGEGCLRGYFQNPVRYNWNYSEQNDLKMYDAMPEDYLLCACDDCKNEQTNNVGRWSEPQIPGGSVDGFRLLRPRNKFIVDPSEGKLTNIFVQNGTLYYHTTDVLRPLQYGRVAVASNAGEMLLGTGGFLQNTTSGGGPIEGFAGLQHHNHQIQTQYGYFFVDQEAAKIYKFDGQLKAISDIDGKMFFKKHLPFCKETECKNNHKAGTSYYAMGVDPRMNRFFITKSDGDPKGSFTLSFDLEQDQWISFHSEIPRAYNWDRYDSYNLQAGGYYKRHSACNWGDYGDVKGDLEIELPVRSNDHREFDYHYTDVMLLVEKCSGCTWIRDVDNFFDEVAIYNSTQSTGWMSTLIDSDDSGKGLTKEEKINQNPDKLVVAKRNREWRFNKVHDNVIRSCECHPMVTCEECEPYYHINEGAIGCTISDGKTIYNGIFQDRFLLVRYRWKSKDLQPILVKTTTYLKNSAD